VTNRGRGGRGFDPHQFQMDWSGGAASPPTTSPEPIARPNAPRADGLVLVLKWDFRRSFPEPTEEALDFKLIEPEDETAEGIRRIHEEEARQMLATLDELQVVRDAKRRHVDPKTNKAPKDKEAKEKLETFFETEPDRLERWFDNLLGVYGEAFGDEAAREFGKAVRAWHAGIEVVSESAPEDPALPPAVAETLVKPVRAKPERRHNPERVPARLPAPRPLPSAIAAGHFGQEENGKPVNPGAHEVREFTKQHAAKLIDLLDSVPCTPASARDELLARFTAGIAAYAEDFGQRAARQLEAYVTRQAGLDTSRRHGF
jgi:hypothetical protein